MGLPCDWRSQDALSRLGPVPSVGHTGEEGSAAGASIVSGSSGTTDVSGVGVRECGGGEEGGGVWCWYALLTGGGKAAGC